jgi:hypothetical protein
MAETADDKLAQGKLDLVPMIDCIMLLLLFFILTTKFSSEEKVIASLLPTDKGQAPTTPSKPVSPPKQVNICVYPEGLTKGFQPSEYQRKLDEMKKSGGVIIANAQLRIGGSDPLQITGKVLNKKSDPGMKQQMEAIHNYISVQLAARETQGAALRRDQDPVVISCFSGLSWKFAIIAYDAVRAYEATKMGSKLDAKDLSSWEKAREVTFAPPRIRNYSMKELGEELYEVVQMN